MSTTEQVTYNPQKPKLYGYFRSSATWRVRIALAWKGIEYEYIPINLVKGEQSSEEHAQRNTFKVVPVLSLPDGTNLVQSTAIMEYLEETHPGMLFDLRNKINRIQLLIAYNLYTDKPLMPKDVLQRCVVRSIINEIACDMQPIQNTKVQAYISSDKDKRVEWANYWLTNGCDALEKHLAKTAGTYCVGDQVTLADCSLYPIAYNAYRYKVDMSKCPTITRILDNLDKLEPFQAAHAHAQSDTLPELRGKTMKDI
ncbi:hypothetical protein INT43_008523 [Umbelopsis isabellina]|uniref:Maleylacetoacetate isomerase n=1 Tax=Mortierella isabellina TaxID=91625 RepID=A0A8H7PW60_MORIS|nr:hypothetical protein INT43_008523 [Umbelopsis isabellina]